MDRPLRLLRVPLLSPSFAFEFPYLLLVAVEPEGDFTSISEAVHLSSIQCPK